MTARRVLRPVLLGLLGATLVLGAWQGAIVAWSLPSYLVPAPAAVLEAGVRQWRVLLGQTGFTLASAGLGLLASTLFATCFALLFTISRRTGQAAMPVLLVFRSAPVAAVAPLIMLAMGRGIGTSIVVVTIVSFFPLLVNLMRGLAAADRNAIELMHVHGASRWQQIALVRLPYAMPYFFTGLRIAAAASILGAMLSEWITGSRGLGNLILDAGEMRETELLWAAVLVSVLVALAVLGLTAAGEARTTRWRRVGSAFGNAP